MSAVPSPTPAARGLPRGPLLLGLSLLALGLGACPGCMGGGAPQPSTHEVRLLPLGQETPEQERIVQVLTETFPGLSVSVLPVEPLPPDIHHEGTLYAELLMAHYRERGPGIVVLLDADLSTQLYSAVYSQVDLPHGNAVLSLPRFRTLAGMMPKDPEAPLSEEALERSRVRAGRQAVNAVGKLIGLFPCKEERCVYHRSDTVEILDRADQVCDRHLMTLPAMLEFVKQRAAEADGHPASAPSDAAAETSNAAAEAASAPPDAAAEAASQPSETTSAPPEAR